MASALRSLRVLGRATAKAAAQEGPIIMRSAPEATLLEAAQDHGINMSGACDGVLECSTCHCVLEKEDFDKLEAPSGTERDLLDSAWGLTDTSRLSCQVKVSDLRDNAEVAFPSAFEGVLPAKSANPKKNEKKVAQTLPVHYSGRTIEKREYTLYTKRAIPKLLKDRMPGVDPTGLLAVASVLPFRSNSYVVDELIDWSNVPNDPMFQLTVPQRGMLSQEDEGRMTGLIRENAGVTQIRDAANDIRKSMNPHPAKQQEMNVPAAPSGDMLSGMQHKYRETMLYFASEGQYCHAYCTYCFRWAQFVGAESLQFANNDHTQLANYVKNTPHLTDVLLTGGDPMVMKSFQLERYITPLLEIPTLKTIRIGSKSLAYWPYRYLTDDDTDDTLKLFEKVAKAGKHLSFMAHFSHPAELQTDAVQEAIRRIRMTGAQIRCQAPVVRHVNDDPDVWTEMWTKQVQMGMVPYYMFVERDTGPRAYFEVPLTRAYDIYTEAVSRVSGLGRTVRGPSMSSTPGKIHVLGTAEVKGEKVFILKFLQARNPAWMSQVFFAKYDPEAVWLDGLKPAFGEEKFFFEDELADMERIALECGGSSGQVDYARACA